VIDSEYQPELSNNTPPFPWPPREGASPLDALAATWKESVFHPSPFFRRMPREFDFGWVLAYYLIVGVIAGGISLFWRMVLGPPALLQRLFPEAVAEAAANPAIDFLLSPLWLLVMLFVMGGIYHLFLVLVGGARKGHGFGTTLRVFAYSVGPQIFVLVPFIGTMAGVIWGLVVTMIGMREAHETTTGKAVAALLIPMFLLGGLAVLLALATLMTGLLPSPTR
jgi:hypothetical protein